MKRLNTLFAAGAALALAACNGADGNNQAADNAADNVAANVAADGDVGGDEAAAAGGKPTVEEAANGAAAADKPAADEAAPAEGGEAGDKPS